MVPEASQFTGNIDMFPTLVHYIFSVGKEWQILKFKLYSAEVCQDSCRKVVYTTEQ